MVLTLFTNMSFLKCRDLLSHVSIHLQAFIFFKITGYIFPLFDWLFTRNIKHKHNAYLIELLMNEEITVSK